jgi:hypothetical protein
MIDAFVIGKYSFTHAIFDDKEVIFIDTENGKGDGMAFTPNKFEELMDKFWKENF